MDTIVTVNAGNLEAWFMNASIPVEIAAAEGIMAVIEAQRNVTYGNVAQVALYLAKLEKSLQNMKRELRRFKDGCKPDVFFNEIKPFIRGWNSDPFKKKNLSGLVFEGVSEKPIGYEGLTAAQTSSLPVFDAALGIQHEPDEETRRLKLRKFMPPSHQRFIDVIAKGPSIKDFVYERGIPLGIELYNHCVQAIVDFRSFHAQNVASFVVIPSHKKGKISKNPKVLQEISASNAGLMRYLKCLRNSTCPKLPQHTDQTWIQQVAHQLTIHWTVAIGIVVLGAGITVYRCM